MTLDRHPNYPGSRSYVLKLHRDAVPRRGLLVGRLESMASGRRFEFCCAEQLIASLLADADPDSTGTPVPASDGDPGQSSTGPSILHSHD